MATYKLNFGGMDFSKGIAFQAIYVGNGTNKVNTPIPSITDKGDLPTVLASYGVTTEEPPVEKEQNLFVFNSEADLSNIVNGSNKCMTVAYQGAYYDIFPDGTLPVMSGVVTGVMITNAGTNYTSQPAVAFTGGGGTGAAGTSLLKAITAAVHAGAGGSGYAVNDHITLANGVVLNVTTVSTGAVTAVSIVTPGSFSGAVSTTDVLQASTTGAGTGFAADLTYGVGGVTITNGGVEYTSAPTVAFSGGGGASAAGTAIISESAAQNFNTTIQVVEANGIILGTNAQQMNFVMNGNPLFSGAIPSSVTSLSTLVTWLTTNYSYLGTFTASGNNVNLAGGVPYTNAFIRFW